jgi:hypothetical protein
MIHWRFNDAGTCWNLRNKGGEKGNTTEEDTIVASHVITTCGIALEIIN